MFARDPHNSFPLPSGYHAALKDLQDVVSNGSIHFSSRHYMGHMLYDVSTPHMDALSAALFLNQNNVAVECSPVTSGFEVEYVRSMSDIIGYDGNSWGYISSGGTASNLMALWIARNKARSEGRRVTKVLGSRFCHYSVTKACDILSLDFVVCETNADGDLVLPNSLDDLLAIVVNMGTTESGMVEDLVNVLDACESKPIFVHVDAAWGGYFKIVQNALPARTKAQFDVLSSADSVSMDPHKLGFCPYGAGTFLLKNATHRKFIDSTTDVAYIDHSVCSSSTLEGSRSGALVTSVYFGHKILYESNSYRDILLSLLNGCSTIKARLRQSSLNIELLKTDLCIILFRFLHNDIPMSYFVTKFCAYHNHRHQSLQFASTKIDGNLYFRLTVMDPNISDYIEEFISQLHCDYNRYVSEFASLNQ
ncbi:hypothetical protein P9112_012706 [Eukaryota sp. TZLM1-RC]